jgi:hypothetical protein
MISVENTHRVIRPITMRTIRHRSSSPEVINPIQRWFLRQNVVSCENHQHLICTLHGSVGGARKEYPCSEIIRHLSTSKSSDCVRIEVDFMSHAVKLYICLDIFCELDCVAGFACENEKVVTIQSSGFVVCLIEDGDTSDSSFVCSSGEYVRQFGLKRYVRTKSFP